MARLFAHAPHVVSGTMQFPERCNLKLQQGGQSLSRRFRCPKARRWTATLSGCAARGCRSAWRPSVEHLRATGLLKKTIPEYQARLDREIDCIKQMKFPGYFMIVWDFIRYAREQGIPVGPGRGSAAGSLVAYCMEITDVDPLQNELLFERFLNPERVSMPDIDIDFCMNRRGEVIEYVKRKYGQRPGGADHHLQHHGGEGGDQGRRPRAGHALRRGGPHRQADSRRPSASRLSRR